MRRFMGVLLCALITSGASAQGSTAKVPKTAQTKTGDRLVYVRTGAAVFDLDKGKDESAYELKEYLNTRKGPYFVIAKHSEVPGVSTSFGRTVVPLPLSEAQRYIAKIKREEGYTLFVQEIAPHIPLAERLIAQQGGGMGAARSRQPQHIGEAVVDIVVRGDSGRYREHRLWDESVNKVLDLTQLTCRYYRDPAPEGMPRWLSLVFWYSTQPTLEAVTGVHDFKYAEVGFIDVAMSTCPENAAFALLRAGVTPEMARRAQLARANRQGTQAHQAKLPAAMSDAELTQHFGPMAPFIKFGLTVEALTDALPGPNLKTMSPEAQANYHARERENQAAAEAREERRQERVRDCQMGSFVRGDTASFYGCR